MVLRGNPRFYLHVVFEDLGEKLADLFTLHVLISGPITFVVQCVLQLSFEEFTLLFKINVRGQLLHWRLRKGLLFEHLG